MKKHSCKDCSRLKNEFQALQQLQADQIKELEEKLAVTIFELKELKALYFKSKKKKPPKDDDDDKTSKPKKLF